MENSRSQSKTVGLKELQQPHGVCGHPKFSSSVTATGITHAERAVKGSMRLSGKRRADFGSWLKMA